MENKADLTSGAIKKITENGFVYSNRSDSFCGFHLADNDKVSFIQRFENNEESFLLSLLALCNKVLNFRVTEQREILDKL